MPENNKLALKLAIQTYRILKNNDEVCIPSLSSILLAVYMEVWLFCTVHGRSVTNEASFVSQRGFK